ncbi:MAG: ABC transporter permease subunit [Acetobacteraceae bacterium]|nr:ABC transporter permease subunit [Acetobacteraceae bacterium]
MRRAVWALVGKELRDQWWKPALGTFLLLLVAAVLPITYTELPRALGQAEVPRFVQEWLANLLGSYATYAWTNWFGKNLYQLLTLFSLILGIGAIATETSRGTLHFLLSQPLKRQQVLGAKYAVAAVLLSGMAVIPTLALAPLSAALGHPLEAALVIKGLPAAIAGTLALLSLGLLLSVLFDEALKAAGVAAGAAFVLALPGWFERTRSLSIFWAMAGHRTFQTGAVPWPAVAALLALASALYLAAAWALERKQL